MVDRLRVTGIIEEESRGQLTRLRDSEGYEASARPSLRLSVKPAPQAQPKRNGLFLIAAAASAVWLLYWGYEGGLLLGRADGAYAPTPLGQLLMVALFAALGPILIGLIVAAVGRMLSFSQDAKRFAVAADRLIQPETTAAGEINRISDAVRDSVEDLNVSLEEASARLVGAERQMDSYVSRIDSAGESFEDRTRKAIALSADERHRLAETGRALNRHAEEIARALDEKSRLVVEASRVAEKQLDVAEQELSRRVTQLGGSARSAIDGAEQLGVQLEAQTQRLSDAAETAERRSEVAVQTFTRQNNDFMTAAELMNEHNARLETAVRDQRDVVERVAEAFASHALQIKQATDAGARALEDAAKSAIASTGEAASAFDAQARGAAEAGGRAASQIRHAASAAEAASAAAKAAAQEVAEAFETQTQLAKQAAEQTASDLAQGFSARQDALRETIDDALRTAEDAGARSVRLVEHVADNASAAQRAVARALSDLDERLAALPDMADAHGRGVRKALEEQISAFRATAENAFREAREFDDHFTEKLRNNYKVLSGLSDNRLEVKQADIPPTEAEPAPQAPAPAPAAPRLAADRESAAAKGPTGRAAAETASRDLSAFKKELEELRSRLPGGEPDPAPLPIRAPSSTTQAARRESAAPPRVTPEFSNHPSDFGDPTVSSPETPVDQTPQSPVPDAPALTELTRSLTERVLSAAPMRPAEPAAPPAPPPASPQRHDASGGKWRWRDILAAADGQEPRQAPAAAPAPGPAASETARRLRAVQDMTLEIERALYGEPSRGLINRFLAGERDLFAERLTKLNPGEVRRRIEGRVRQDRAFADLVRSYGEEFRRLLSIDARAPSARQTVEARLKSPTGQTFVLISHAVGAIN